MENIKRVKNIDELEWQQVSQFNRKMVQDFLDNQIHLSEQSLIQYKSCLKIFFIWVKDNLENKNCTEIKKKEFIKYLNWLTSRGLSESAIKIKKSCMSSFCNYIINFYEDEYPTFRSFVTSEMKVIQTGYVHEKQPLTTSEYKNLCTKLEELEQWQILAWLKFSYSTGCRRAESLQLLKEVIDYKPIIKQIKTLDKNGNTIIAESKFYKTHKIRCKGKSKVGKVRQLQFSQDAMDAIKKWLEVRGDDDCPYVFVVKTSNDVKHASVYTFNAWCANILTDLLGRRIHPHLLRESRATNLIVEDGKSVEIAQKLLGHESSETTLKHYIIREDTEDACEAFI